MKERRIRLGPLALLMTVILICIVVLAILTLTTAGADRRLAMRQARTITEQYERESQGQRFLALAADACAKGEDLTTLAGVTKTEEGLYEKSIATENAVLVIALKQEGDSFTVESWRTEANWSHQAEIDNIWEGN